MIASIQAQTNPSQTQTTAPPAAASVEPEGFSIDFPGGTPGELVDWIAKQSGARPNVIIPPYMADIQIPRFKLQSVNTGQIFDALNMVSDERGARELRWISEGAKDRPNRVWTLVKAPSPQRPETCQIIFIGGILGTFQLDDINTAIRTAWEMLNKSSTASLKFHKETQLLIAKGNEDELKIVTEVLKSLEVAVRLKGRVEPAQ